MQHEKIASWSNSSTWQVPIRSIVVCFVYCLSICSSCGRWAITTTIAILRIWLLRGLNHGTTSRCSAQRNAKMWVETKCSHLQFVACEFERSRSKFQPFANFNQGHLCGNVGDRLHVRCSARLRTVGRVYDVQFHELFVVVGLLRWRCLILLVNLCALEWSHAVLMLQCVSSCYAHWSMSKRNKSVRLNWKPTNCKLLMVEVAFAPIEVEHVRQ